MDIAHLSEARRFERTAQAMVFIKTLKVYLVGRYSNRVELTGLEPATSWLQTRRSTN
jgi:hypothetical protein